MFLEPSKPSVSSRKRLRSNNPAMDHDATTWEKHSAQCPEQCIDPSCLACPCGFSQHLTTPPQATSKRNDNDEDTELDSRPSKVLRSLRKDSFKRPKQPSDNRAHDPTPSSPSPSPSASCKGCEAGFDPCTLRCPSDGNCSDDTTCLDPDCEDGDKVPCFEDCDDPQCTAPPCPLSNPGSPCFLAHSAPTATGTIYCNDNIPCHFQFGHQFPHTDTFDLDDCDFSHYTADEGHGGHGAPLHASDTTAASLHPTDYASLEGFSLESSPATGFSDHTHHFHGIPSNHCHADQSCCHGYVDPRACQLCPDPYITGVPLPSNRAHHHSTLHSYPQARSEQSGTASFPGQEIADSHQSHHGANGYHIHGNGNMHLNHGQGAFPPFLNGNPMGAPGGVLGAAPLVPGMANTSNLRGDPRDFHSHSTQNHPADMLNDIVQLLQHTAAAHRSQSISVPSLSPGPFSHSESPFTSSTPFSTHFDEPFSIDGDGDSDDNKPHICMWDLSPAHDGSKPCSRQFPTAAALQTHYQKDHVQTNTGANICRWINCPAGEKDFAQRSKLTRHGILHTRHRPYQCTFPNCTRSFGTNQARENHMRVHTGTKPYHCPHCEYKTTTQTQLQTHINSVHEGLKRHKCAYCAFTCSDSSNLTKHERTHRVRAYGCPYPGCGFRPDCRWENAKRHFRTSGHCREVLVEGSREQREYRERAAEEIRRWEAKEEASGRRKGRGGRGRGKERDEGKVKGEGR